MYERDGLSTQALICSAKFSYVCFYFKLKEPRFYSLNSSQTHIANIAKCLLIKGTLFYFFLRFRKFLVKTLVLIVNYSLGYLEELE